MEQRNTCLYIVYIYIYIYIYILALQEPVCSYVDKGARPERFTSEWNEKIEWTYIHVINVLCHVKKKIANHIRKTIADDAWDVKIVNSFLLFFMDIYRERDRHRDREVYLLMLPVEVHMLNYMKLRVATIIYIHEYITLFITIDSVWKHLFYTILLISY